VALGIDGVAWWGYLKENTQELAQFVAAEAKPSDLLIVAPGSLGTSFNYETPSRLSQIDFPFMGAVQRYPFDHHFERMAGLTALQATLDSIEAAAVAGRRVWMVMQADWVRTGVQPWALDAGRYGALGAADASRANYLRGYLQKHLGAAATVLVPDSSVRSTEQLQAELFVPARHPASATP
jgi:hypothetical protein